MPVGHFLMEGKVPIERPRLYNALEVTGAFGAAQRMGLQQQDIIIARPFISSDNFTKTLTVLAFGVNAISSKLRVQYIAAPPELLLNVAFYAANRSVFCIFSIPTLVGPLVAALLQSRCQNMRKALRTEERLKYQTSRFLLKRLAQKSVETRRPLFEDLFPASDSNALNTFFNVRTRYTTEFAF
ncbi:hypothetical protein T265_06368 [Opisthorchis viverrini]|uniref:Uncharacterized protein n=1 Tax=Opisthorchis viverrini TaxID=6198 RepID=A0A074ZGH7_OPIVI|nr:hypothetical protein T265_06368 [Opisthorchis viverrini]KER26391.1 hypothetical protein T265_06368 [Opisthorchis viverrini]